MYPTAILETWQFLKKLNIYLHSDSDSEVAQSCPTLCDPRDCSPPGSSVHGILQARILEWVAISFSRGSSRPRNQTQVSHIASRCFYHLSHEGFPLIICLLLLLNYSSLLCLVGEGNGTPLQHSMTFAFHFHALEKDMATHSSVLAWRIPGMGEPGGLPSMGSHRVRHD